MTQATQVERVGKGDLMAVLGEKLKAKGVDCTVAEVSAILDSTVDSIVELMKTKGKVNLPGFGTFVLIKTDARNARNPQSGVQVKVPAKIRPKFRAALNLQSAFNK